MKTPERSEKTYPATLLDLLYGQKIILREQSGQIGLCAG